MGKKNKGGKKVGVVYSTNPDFEYQHEDHEEETLPPEEQVLYVSIDKHQRKGKVVTLVNGFTGHSDDLSDLAKMLKSKCGTGGSAKEGEIIIQGEFREKVTQLLTKEGYTVKQR